MPNPSMAHEVLVDGVYDDYQIYRIYHDNTSSPWACMASFWHRLSVKVRSASPSGVYVDWQETYNYATTHTVVGGSSHISNLHDKSEVSTALVGKAIQPYGFYQVYWREDNKFMHIHFLPEYEKILHVTQHLWEGDTECVWSDYIILYYGPAESTSTTLNATSMDRSVKSMEEAQALLHKSIIGIALYFNGYTRRPRRRPDDNFARRRPTTCHP